MAGTQDDRSYWKGRLGERLPSLALPVDRRAGEGRGWARRPLRIALEAGALGKLGAASEDLGLAGLFVLLRRYCRQADLLVGLRGTAGTGTPTGTGTPAGTGTPTGAGTGTSAGRRTLPLRLAVGGGSFRALLEAVRSTRQEAEAHGSIGLEELAKELGLATGEPPGQVAFSSAKEAEGGAASALHLACQVEGDALAGELGYAGALYDEASIDRLVGHLGRLLTAAVAAPDTALMELPLLDEAERRLVVETWNQTAADYPRDRSFPQLFAEQAARSPEAIAAAYEGTQLSYRELDRRSNQLAHHLRGLGVGPDVLVAVFLERALEVPVALLAVLKAGGAYVPIDPGYPQDRVAFMLEDSRAPVVITQSHLRDRLPPSQAQVLDLGTYLSNSLSVKTEGQSAGADAPPSSGAGPEHLAYVIYTSGSTGRPKGAMIHHRGLVNYLSWAARAYQMSDGTGAPTHSSLSFDLTITSLFLPLLVGRTVVLAREDHGVEALAGLLRKDRGYSLVKITPAHLEVLKQQLPPGEAAGRTGAFIIGGEALFMEGIAYWRQHAPRTRLINEYGPTETVVGCCVYEVPADSTATGAVPIGRPIANTQMYVLDEQLSPLPVGVPGELYIGGDGVARGYLNRPELTAERFLPNPFVPGGRMYKTGDLGRWLPDGNLEYQGRVDHQVKVRGYRIELGEIESVLTQHPAVAEATVLARQDGESSGDRRLVAYLVGRAPEAAPSAADLKLFLKDRLPEYMVPAHFVALPRMPLTQNGKVDRERLPAPEDVDVPATPTGAVASASSGNAAAAASGPRNPVEELVVAVWKKVLKLKQVDLQKDFFDEGGDSLKAAFIVNRLQQKLGETLYVSAVFEAPTVEKLAVYLQENYPEAVAKLGGAPAQAAATQPARVPSRVVDAQLLAQFRGHITALPAQPAETPKNPPAIFVLSPPRSGTTLLRVMLAGSARIFSPPELELLCFNTLAERATTLSGKSGLLAEGTVRALMELHGIDAAAARAKMEGYEREGMSVQRFYRLLQEAAGGRILLDKTTTYAFDRAQLDRAEAYFEGARYIHLSRHPYDTCRSFEEARIDQIFLPSRRWSAEPRAFTPREQAELIWLVSQENILAFLGGVPAERQRLVRFEDLVTRPREVMTELASFVGVPFEEGMLQPYQDKKQRMTDGLHDSSEARMFGDPKFHTHQGIDAQAAGRWKREQGSTPLGAPTLEVARRLGYDV